MVPVILPAATEPAEPVVFWFKVGNVQLVKVPDDGVPNAPPCTTIVELASGSVNVFSAVVGPVNLVNPLPVPPYVEAII